MRPWEARDRVQASTGAPAWVLLFPVLRPGCSFSWLLLGPEVILGFGPTPGSVVSRTFLGTQLRRLRWPLGYREGMN